MHAMNLAIIGTEIIVKSHQNLVSDGRNQFYCTVSFSKEWENKAISIVFNNVSSPVFDGIVKIPSSALNSRSMRISAVAISDEQTLRTSTVHQSISEAMRINTEFGVQNKTEFEEYKSYINEQILKLEEIAENLQNGDDYVITAEDYEQIADIVVTKFDEKYSKILDGIHGEVI